ncbi:prolipoprotein diacylglyceryl transferase [Luteolibacter algae]|uniref:Phosphatidylglycerol--prolipoprotein diacylglyceryl transferase n=1 Tax=Luteolibacter algae TaxID=454151 RepID=A0ABW5D987_9BACT
MFATYVHQFNPIIFQLSEGIALRWYGLAYLAGFLGGYLLLKHLAERKLWVLPPEKTADFIAAAALLGVFLGGRLGYILFYQIPRDGWNSVLSDPLVILRVWEGGMASHGGILGLVIFTFFYARKHKVSWTGLGDGLCVVAPIGLMCGRLANFINGELYGRVANHVAWAVKFPTAFFDGNAPESERFNDALAAAASADPGFAARLSDISQTVAPQDQQFAFFQSLLESNRNSDLVNKAIEPFLDPRHPSQLYEGLLEGALLFSILWVIRIKFPKAPNGLLTGLFFGLYASFRIFAEQFREPDAAWVIEGMLTQGQFLSLFMYLFSAAFLVFAWRGWRRDKSAV